jgi:hypothetical protein
MTDVGGLVILLSWLELAVIAGAGLWFVLRRSADDPLAEARRRTDGRVSRRSSRGSR